MAVVVAAFIGSLFVGVTRNPANGLSAALLVYAFEQFAQANVPFLLAHTALINIVFAFLVIWGLIQRMRRGERIATNLSHGTIMLAMLYVAHPISALWAPNPDVTIAGFLHAAPYILVLTFLPSLAVRGVDDLASALRTLWLFGAIVLVLILITGDFASRGLVLQKLSRTRVDVANPLALSQMAGAVAIVAGIIPLGRSRISQVLGLASVVLGLYMCVRTGSRGQFGAAAIALAFGMCLQAWAGTIRTWQAAIFAVVGIVVLAWLYGVASEQFGNRFDLDRMQSEYEGGRVAPSEGLLRSWAKAGPWAWVFGLGGSASFHYIGFYPHVVPMEVLTELGALGLLLYVGFALLAMSRARWLIGAVTRDKRDVIICACSLFAYEWILACKQGAMLGADFMMCHGLILCGIAQTWKVHHEVRREAPSSPVVHGLPMESA